MIKSQVTGTEYKEEVIPDPVEETEEMEEAEESEEGDVSEESTSEGTEE